jgi:hypothetical protein
MIETLTPWVILSSFDGSAGDEGYEPKDEFERQKGFKGSWGFAAGSFARELGQRKTLFYFWYTKGLIPNSPNTRTVVVTYITPAYRINNPTNSQSWPQ